MKYRWLSSFIFLIITVFATALEEQFIDFIFGGVHFYLIDIYLIITFLQYIIINLKNIGQLENAGLFKVPILIFLIGLIPLVVIGIINENTMQSIIRDLRVTLHFAAFFPFLWFLKNNYKFDIQRMIAYFGIIAAVIMLLFLLLGMERAPLMPDWTYRTVLINTGELEQGFGYPSSYPFFAIAFLYFFKEYNYARTRKWVYGLLCLILSIAVICTFGRGLFIGFVLSSICITLFIMFKMRRKSKLNLIGFPLFLIVAIIIVLFVQGKDEYVYERYLSILIPEISSSGPATNRAYRLRSMEIAYEENVWKERFLFGAGLGDYRTAGIEDIEMMNHNSYGWAIKKGGIYLLSLFGLFIVLIFRRIAENFYIIDDSGILIISGIIFLCLLNFATSSLMGSYCLNSASTISFLLAIYAAENGERLLGKEVSC